MRKPLDGIKVLDFTHGVAGPYCTMLLADLGCDVIKIEKPERGDATRYMNISERFMGDIPRTGGDYFLAINRNKRAITVDVKTEEGRALCKELAAWCDVAVQNFRPGVMKRLGLDFAALKEVNERIIYANLSAYGRKGPLAEKPGMDVAVQARSGVMRLTGAPDSVDPIRPGVSLADFGGGAFLAMAVLTALYDRERTGEGQEVDVSLLDATMSLLSNYAVAVIDGAAVLKPVGSGHPQLVPYQAFPSKDGFIVISAGTNKIYRTLCEAMEVPELGEDARFRTNQDRVRNREELVPLMSEITRTRTTAEWEELFDKTGVPCAPVNTMAEAFAEEQLLHNEMICAIDHPEAGEIHVTGVPFKFGSMAGDIRRPPPVLGEHTDQVLGEVLNYNAERIQALRKNRVI